MYASTSGAAEGTPLLASAAGTVQVEELTATTALEKANEALTNSTRLLQQGNKEQALRQAIEAERYATLAISLAQADQDEDGGMTTASVVNASLLLGRIRTAKASAQSPSQRLVTNAYHHLFGRKGFFNTTPFIPGPKLPVDWKGGPYELAYFGARDGLSKGIVFFLMQSMTSTAGYYILDAIKPPGQVFDIRSIIARQAAQDFSVYLQFVNLPNTATLSAIFCMIAIPAVLLVTLGVVFSCLNQDIKDRTVKAYNSSNSWRDAFKLYGWQGAEVLVAVAMTNTILLMAGEPLEPVWNDPMVVNLIKVALAIGLNVTRNVLAKGLTEVKDKAPCCSRAQLSPA